jgi:NADPH:quinone reductase-like Zn-dependent oxidoreductase
VKAIRVHRFGGIDALVCEETQLPTPGEGQVLVHVKAAGVGPWDAWVRNGTSAVSQALPLTLGADFSGIVERFGSGAVARSGDAVYGVTNTQFTGAYADYAVAESTMIAPKPASIGFVEAASVPVVASTAWQMLFEHGAVDATKRVLVHGAGGNVGAYAVQMAKRVAREVIATVLPGDVEYVRALGADIVIDVSSTRFDAVLSNLDVVVDTVGGDTLARSFKVLKKGGVLVSSVAPPDQHEADRCGVRGIFFLVRVSSAELTRLANLIDDGQLTTSVGEVLPLSNARLAHEMLAGRPHRRGKIVLVPDATTP